jgi:hypothetical protein
VKPRNPLYWIPISSHEWRPAIKKGVEQGMNSAAACALKIVENAFTSLFFSFVHRCCTRSESFKMSKIQFQFSVFVHRLWPDGQKQACAAQRKMSKRDITVQLRTSTK